MNFRTLAVIVGSTLAIGALVIVLRRPRVDELAHLIRGKVFFEEDRYLDAEREFGSALAAAPDDPLVWRSLATVLIRGSRDYARSAELFEKTLDRTPTDAGAWFGLGVALRFQQDFEGAERAFAKAREFAPTDLESAYYHGEALQDLDRDEEARACFERVLELDPDDGAALYKLSQLLRRSDPARSQLLRERHEELKRTLGQDAVTRGSGSEWSPLLALRIPEPKQPIEPPAPAAVTLASSATLQGAGPTTALASGDVDGDGDVDLFVGGLGLLTNDGTGAFSPARSTVALAGVATFPAAAALLVDFDNDRDLDLVVGGANGSMFLANDGRGAFVDATTTSKLGAVRVRDWTPFDSDHEGDVDLWIHDGARVALWRNELPPVVANDPGAVRAVSFEDVGVASGLVADGANVAFTVGDFENGNDTDAVVLAQDADGRLFTNRRGNRFQDIGLAADVAALRARAVVTADFDGDGWLDLALANDAGVQLATNRGDGTFGAPRSLAPWPAIARLEAFDVDSDGQLDLCAIDADAIRVLRNARGSFTDATSSVVKGNGGGVRVVACDVDADQDADLVVLRADGSVDVLKNSGAAGNHGLELSLQGFRSNAFGLGCKVEIRRGHFYAKREVTQPTLLLGLGDSPRLDDVSLVWSNGVRQHYLDVDTADAGWIGKRELRAESDPDVAIAHGSPRRLVLTQIDRRAGSCPLLYTWDGTQFRFVTDVLCSSPLGLDIGEGARALPNPYDWFMIPPGALVERDGRYALNVTEELRELTYLDRAQLIVIDHPRDVEMFTNNTFTFPPFPGFETFAVRDRSPIRRALDDRGDDVTARLAASDRQYVDSFRRCLPPMQGMAEPHTLTLEFEAPREPAAGERVRLFLEGWFYWTDSSVNHALVQDGSWEFTPPLLEVGDGAGGFRPAGMVGLPAGDSKIIVCDLTDVLRRDDPRIRITTNLQVYWDRAFIAVCGDGSRMRATSLDAAQATLRYRGYSRRVFPDGKEPHVYDYDDVVDATELYGSAYFHHAGRYTRFGDVRPLLDAADDRYVIMDHGDEVALEFDAKALPPLGENEARSFVLHLVGWAKDGDHNSSHGTTVEPLPFLAMSGYPYPDTESYPDDEVHRAYREEWNTRVRVARTFEQPPRRRPPMPAFAETKPFALTDVTAASSVDFRHAEGRVLLNLEDTMGSGAAWGDVDGDGDDDLFLVQGRGPGGKDVLPGKFTSRLYRNDGGMRFTDITARSGAGVVGSGMAALFSDLDGDGDQDLFVTNYGANVLLENDGRGRFTDVTQRAGVALPHYNSGVAAGDYDKDGDLDLYLGRYVTIDESARPQEAPGFGRGFVRDDPPSVLPMAYPPAPNVLLRNDGDLRFTDVTQTAGVADELGKTLGVLFIDVDEDGWLDLLVANDVTPNNFFRNLGDGRFESLAFDVGLDDPRGGMGVGAFDVDGDLDYDLAVTYWQMEPNAIYRNNLVRHTSKKSRVPAFQDVATELGFARPSVGSVGWGMAVVDFDNDTHLDAFVANGYTSPDYETTMLCEPQLPLLFRGDETGAFHPLGEARYGEFVGRKWNGRGVATSDADRDGDLDVVFTQNNGEAVLLRNDGGERSQWLAVDLEGVASPRDPAGARVEVKLADRTLTRQLFLGSSYLCTDTKTLHFGLGRATQYEDLRVRWPSGKVTTLPGGRSNQRLTIREE
ncbi:MAG: VCBS repeat-containing protein [Planctomycetes bacterium]|nr:VCBS repeat-containing protein [Planctomycetota bacterium]